MPNKIVYIYISYTYYIYIVFIDIIFIIVYCLYRFYRHVVFAPAATVHITGAGFRGITDAMYEIADNDAAAWEKVKVGSKRYNLKSVSQLKAKQLVK